MFLRRCSEWIVLLQFVLVSSVCAAEPMAAAVQPFVDRQELAGAVMLVANRDKVLSQETAGFADVAAKKAMSPDAVFWIASQSKPITGCALMILVDEGKVRVDDPVEKYLPEFKGQKVVGANGDAARLPAHPITVRNVLAHTSGLPFKSKAEEPTLDGLPLADAVRSYAEITLQWEPDSKYLYSNAGINIAGRIVEVVSGEPFEDFLQQRLFAPLGMKDTTFWPNEEQLARLAKPYKPNAAKDGLEETRISQLRYPLNDRQRRFPMPAGGLFSTAADCGRLCRMMLRGGELDGKRVLSEAAVKQLTSKQTGELKDGYGLGWSVTGTTFGHGGALSTNMNVDVQRELVTVWLVQHAGFPGEGGKAQNVFRQAALERFGK